MSRNIENCVEFISGDMTCTASFTSQRHINKIKKLHERYEKDFCTPPTKREMTEDERQALRDRLAEARRKH